MAKAPRESEVKTRLVPPLTFKEAADLSSCFLRDLAGSIVNLDPLVQPVCCFAPEGAEASFRNLLPDGFLLLSQRGDSLASRLTHAVDDLFSAGFRTVCLIGADSPTVPATVLKEAIRVIGNSEHQIVLGPSQDGGYYLIGLNSRYPELFEGIAWSTNMVVRQTTQRANSVRLSIYSLPTHYDIDNANDLAKLCDELLGPARPSDKTIAPITRSFLARLIAKEGRERIWPVQCHSGKGPT
jgi:rSAM/selenodomain-associated transferase 1